MKIGFDCDGILTNMLEFEIINGRKFFKDSNKKYNTDSLDFKKIFNCGKKEEAHFWSKYVVRYCLGIKSRKGMSELINKLKQDGHEIYIITARVHTTEKGLLGKVFRIMQEKWLEKENIPYDHIIYVNEKNSAIEKSHACLNNSIDVMVEDQSKNIDALKNITTVMFFKENHNKNSEDKNAIMVRNVKELSMQINNLIKEKILVKKGDFYGKR